MTTAAPLSPQRLLLAFALLPILLAAAGCGPSFRPTGYLDRYDDLVFVGGNSDLAYALIEGAPLDLRCDGIYLPEPIWRSGVLPRHEKLRVELGELMQQRLFHWLKTTYADAGLQVSSTPPDTARLALAGKRAYALEVAVTEVRRGFGLVRWLIGFYAGATTLQVEGTLRTLPEREPLARFVCRVVFSGDSYGGLNPRAFSTRYCLRVSTDWAARDIAALPGLLFTALNVEPPEESASE